MSKVTCPVLAVNHNNLITEKNVNSLVLSSYATTPGTRVRVSCYVPASYTLRGSSQVVCQANGQWSPGVPSCVRKSNNVKVKDSTPDADTTSPPDSDGDSLSDISIVIIGAAGFVIAVLVIVVIIFLCRHCRGPHRHEDEMKKPLHAESRESLPPAKVDFVKLNVLPPPYHDVKTVSGPAPSWHSHPIISMADKYSIRSWSQLSVDRFLRDMETSRRDNPFHSWRDFTSIVSSYRSPSTSFV